MTPKDKKFTPAERVGALTAYHLAEMNTTFANDWVEREFGSEDVAKRFQEWLDTNPDIFSQERVYAMLRAIHVYTAHLYGKNGESALLASLARIARDLAKAEEGLKHFQAKVAADTGDVYLGGEKA